MHQEDRAPICAARQREVTTRVGICAYADAASGERARRLSARAMSFALQQIGERVWIDGLHEMMMEARSARLLSIEIRAAARQCDEPHSSHARKSADASRRFHSTHQRHVQIQNDD